MACTLENLQLMICGIARQMAHIAGFHHLILAAGDPEAGHREAVGQPGQLPDGPWVGAAGQ
jgi:hypothetical protein